MSGTYSIHESRVSRTRACIAPFLQTWAFRWNPLRIRLRGGTAALVLLLATFAHAQDSQFTFDANGNLLVQTAEITAPPQIIGQPLNRIVAPGDSASFFVVAAETRALTDQ